MRAGQRLPKEGLEQGLPLREAGGRPPPHVPARRCRRRGSGHGTAGTPASLPLPYLGLRVHHNGVEQATAADLQRDGSAALGRNVSGAAGAQQQQEQRR